jgi:hypothetical protein
VVPIVTVAAPVFVAPGAGPSGPAPRPALPLGADGLVRIIPKPVISQFRTSSKSSRLIVSVLVPWLAFQSAASIVARVTVS